MTPISITTKNMFGTNRWEIQGTLFEVGAIMWGSMLVGGKMNCPALVSSGFSA